MTGLLDAYAGHLAGLATSLLWTGTSLLFTAAARRLGPTIVNATRISFAIVLLGLTHRLLTGQWIPDAQPGQVLFLALSGIVGLSVGDQALFTAFVHIGPRLSMLIMTTAPLFAALFGRLVLGETLHRVAGIGIALTVGGVAWVVLERPTTPTATHTTHRARGVLLAFVGAACQAGGLLLSKQGIGHGWLPPEEHIAPQTATLIRMVFAGIGVMPLLIIRSMRRRRQHLTGVVEPGLRSPTAGLLFTFGGAVVGPFLGVWMSLVAADRAPLGIAQTLCSLTPIFILPFVVLIHKERVSARAAFGALIAVTGSALLFFRPG